MKSEVRCLAIKQPWANAIIYCGKNIENRTWDTRYRGKFFVHASKSIDKNAPQWVWDLTGRNLQTGGIIGSVELIDVIEKSDSKWFQGPYGFILSNPQPMLLLPQKGQLNFFKANFLEIFTDSKGLF